MRPLIQRLAEWKIFLDPPLIIAEETEVPNLDADKNDPNNQYLSPQVVQQYVNMKSPIYEPPAYLQTAGREAFEKQQEFVEMCNPAGVRIIAGTDGPGIGSLLPGFGLHRELELLVASGLSPLQALRAATLTAQKLSARRIGWKQWNPGSSRTWSLIRALA